MDPSLLKSDCVARCVDNAIYIVLGVLVVVFAPRQLHKKWKLVKLLKKSKNYVKSGLAFRVFVDRLWYFQNFCWLILH